MLETISGLTQMAAALVGLELHEKSVRFRTDKYGYLCLNFRRPAFYISPNGSMWASTVLVGRATRSQKMDAVRRRVLFGLKPEDPKELVQEHMAWREYLMFRSDSCTDPFRSCDNCGHTLTRFEAHRTNVCVKCLTSGLKRLLDENKGLRKTITEIDVPRRESCSKVRTFRERICYALVHQNRKEIYDDFNSITDNLLLDTPEDEEEWKNFIKNIGAGGA